MDRARRRILSRRLSNTMDAAFRVKAPGEAPDTYARPEIFGTDQGSRFTGFDFIDALKDAGKDTGKDAGVTVFLDGRGRCMDDIFIERLWRALKDEAACLHEPTGGFHAGRVIAEWIGFYNTGRPHSALGESRPVDTERQGSRLAHIHTGLNRHDKT